MKNRGKLIVGAYVFNISFDENPQIEVDVEELENGTFEQASNHIRWLPFKCEIKDIGNNIQMKVCYIIFDNSLYILVDANITPTKITFEWASYHEI